MDILISLLIVLLVLGIVYWVITMMPLPPPVKTGALILLGLVAILYLLGLLGVIPWQPFRLR